MYSSLKHVCVELFPIAKFGGDFQIVTFFPRAASTRVTENDNRCVALYASRNHIKNVGIMNLEAFPKT